MLFSLGTFPAVFNCNCDCVVAFSSFCVCVCVWQVWEHYVSQGDYLVGDSFTLADVAFFPCLAYLVRVGLEVDVHFPHLRRYFARVCRRESVLNTWPPHWRDSPGLSYLSEHGVRGPIGVPKLDCVEENPAAEDDSGEE